MIPFFQFNTIVIGPITIQVWGLLVSLGIVASLLLMTHLAKKFMLSKEVALDLAVWVLIVAFVGARIFHVLFYNLDFFIQNPVEIFKFWHGGASSFGGFFGALAAVWLFTKRRRISWKEFLPYFDIGVVSLWLGWGIGRIGCFLTHLHPGISSHSFLAVRFSGGSRFDLGLIESIVGFVLFIIFFLLLNKLIKKQWGLTAIYSSMAYSVIRFFTDFLRATDLPDSDARYARLTPAQWGLLLVFIFLTIALVRSRIKAVKSEEEKA